MTPETKWIAHFACCCVIATPLLIAQANGIKRLYVEPFTTKSGTEKIRDDVLSELGKLKTISLVPAASGADVTLGGGGEIWVRGYRSFSPRSHMKLPTNGTPVYGGYLAVELRNQAGETLWSSLVTPGTGSDDISKDLSKRIAKNVAQVVERGLTALPAIPVSNTAAELKGAGSTFAFPVYEKWITNYRQENPNLRMTYDSVGSEAGIRRLLAGEVDFGASDNPQAIREVAPDAVGKYLLYPSIVGAVVPIVNIPGVPSDIALTPQALAGIYSGKIRKWNDPVLQQANPRLHLPNLDVVVVHRADGSGTTYAWTDFLSATNPAWKADVGASLAPKWPVGRGADGNEGVANLVKELGGSIGYVEFIYALQHHLSYGKVRNRNGEFVSASLESMETAVHQSVSVKDDLTVSIVDAPGVGAYPITSFTWIILPNHIADDVKRSAIVSFLRWMLGPGQRQAAALGYLALPADVVSREEAAIDKIR